VVLGICVDILLVTMLYEGIHTASVPSSISAEFLSQGLLHLDGCYRRILSCDLSHFCLHLRSGRFILESNDRAHLCKPQSFVVSQCLSIRQRRLPLILTSRFTNAGINIVTDIGIGVLPLPVVNSLHLPRSRKYALMAVFALGGLYVVQD
jgi:hypothetical protein